MSVTVEELQKAIEKYEDGDDGDRYGNVYEQVKWGEVVVVPGLGKLELVDSFGGEGQGDDYWVVFKVGEQLFRVDGWYASYDGGELDGTPYEVVAKPVSGFDYVKANQ